MMIKNDDRSPAKSNSIRTCDALVVGGGPAGLAAGVALRLRGLDVVVADALIPPIDKACGEGLLPDSRRELAKLGVRLRGGHEFSGIRFANQNNDREDLVSARFASGKGFGIRRVDLHESLVERAQEVGVRLMWGSRVDLSGHPPTTNCVTVGGEAYHYRYMIGADGESSRVRRWAGLEEGSLHSERLGFRRHYRVAPWNDSVEVYWCDLGEAYVTPVAHDEVCVAALTSRRGLNFEGVLEGLPRLKARLSGKPTAGRDRGSVTTTRRLRQVTRGNIALVGDASGTVDALAGSGLGSAFSEALLLGETLGRDAIEEYAAGHGKIIRLSQTTASIMMFMERSPSWRNRVMRMLAGSPELFAGMLAIHTGAESIGHFAATRGLQLGFRTLFPKKAHPTLDSFTSSLDVGLPDAAAYGSGIPMTRHRNIA